MGAFKVSAIILVLLSIAYQTVNASQTCMYCKRMDTHSGFLYSYSYCPAADNEACVADDWDYINSKCSDKMREGYLLDIDADCGANQQLCFDFESNNLAINNPITK